ncbi:glycerate kinase [Aciditerrimonas ferrireducens]|uniref:glycerate kinase n=1 Tax=Aciditerrimonas ferrireducens TaxID=667306 RepID=UPI0020065419|nr:glycerate kinase [Aciditerrimonas ferrireducens]MCK4175929.1 glycerate kinase [Aciditerrimonas ferrireducens]
MKELARSAPDAEDQGVRDRVVLAFDSFKGSAGASQLVAAAEHSTAELLGGFGLRADPCPLSDGGEGFLEALAPCAPTWHWLEVSGPLGQPVRAPWASGPRLALVESARAVGLPLAGGPEGNDPLGATSAGVGELLAAALAAGAPRVLVGVGGTASTDGGQGAVAALDAAGLADQVAGRVWVACDVRVPFRDAAWRFGPQKGAGPTELAALAARLDQLAAGYATRAGRPIDQLPGSGAGGGLAGGLAALGARLVPGAPLVGRLLGLPGRLRRARLVLSGEGRLDGTSWLGKVVGELARLAARRAVPLAVLAGSLAGPAEELVPPGLRGTVRACWALSDLVGEEAALADPTGSLAQVLPGLLADLLARP